MIKITIDSNLINVKGEIQEMNILEQWHASEIIEIVGSQRLFNEMGDLNKARFKKASNYLNIIEPLTIGYSTVGNSYVGTGEPKFKEIATILFPSVKDFRKLNDNQANDVMHLIAHTVSDSQIFVTNNLKDFLHNDNKTQDCLKQRQLKEMFNILVMTPKECLNFIQSSLSI